MVVKESSASDRVAKKLNDMFNCEDFAVHKLTIGEVVTEV